jgi:hypothetical protein
MEKVSTTLGHGLVLVASVLPGTGIPVHTCACRFKEDIIVKRHKHINTRSLEVNLFCIDVID